MSSLRTGRASYLAHEVPIQCLEAAKSRLRISVANGRAPIAEYRRSIGQ
jgi:hypothetical protein